MMAFEHRKDSGRLMAATSKRHEKAPDYWGEIAIDVKDLTKVERQGDLLVFKLNGWKRKSQGGMTYLSLAVDRYVENKPSAKPQKKDDDLESDIPW
jgi:hypothetical protein